MESAWAESVRSELYPELAFGGYSRFDGTVAFYLRVRSLVHPSTVVLDLGCGTGAHLRANPQFVRSLQQLRGLAAVVIGADVVAKSATNPSIDRFLLIEKGRIPLDAATIDLCVTDWTVEHLAEVGAFFAEMARVLRPGGYVCIRTPNRFHYSSIGAALLPFRVHKWVRTRLGQFHTATDVFPTYYRCNTRGAMKRCLAAAGLEGVVHFHRGESHLSGAGRVLGLLGEFFERLAPPALHHELHVFGRKPEAAVRSLPNQAE